MVRVAVAVGAAGIFFVAQSHSNINNLGRSCYCGGAPSKKYQGTERTCTFVAARKQHGGM